MHRPTRHRLARRGATVLLASLVVAAASCATPPPRARIRRTIVGGTEAPVGAYPETVALMDLASGDPASYFCTGTLIAPDAVLAAAHCMFDWNNNLVRAADVGIFFGHDAQSVPFAEIKPVSKFFVPSAYPRGQVTDPVTGMGRDDDISLLVLATPVADVTPAPILDLAQVDTIAQGTMMLLVGFGATTLDGTGPDGIMYFATSPYQSHSSYELLIGAPSQPDTCFGDSGGPAFLDQGGTRILVGVTVRPANNTTVDCGEGGIYTLAPAYLDWIAQSLASLDGGTPPSDAGVQRDLGLPDGDFPLGDGGRVDGPAGDGHGGSDGGGGHSGRGCAVAPGLTGGQHNPSVSLLLLLGGLVVAGSHVRPGRRRRTPD